MIWCRTGRKQTSGELPETIDKLVMSVDNWKGEVDEYAQISPKHKPRPSSFSRRASGTQFQSSESSRGATSTITYRAGRFSSDGRQVLLQTRNATPEARLRWRRDSVEYDQISSLADAISKLSQQQKRRACDAQVSRPCVTSATNAQPKWTRNGSILRPKTWPSDDLSESSASSPGDASPQYESGSHPSSSSAFLRDDLISQGTEIQINIMLGHAKLSFHQRDYQQMLKSAEQAYKLATSVFENYPPLIARCDLYLAIGHYRLGDWEVAEVCIRDAEACIGAYQEGEAWQSWRDRIIEGKSEAKTTTSMVPKASAMNSKGSNVLIPAASRIDRTAAAPSTDETFTHDVSIHSRVDNISDPDNIDWTYAGAGDEKDLASHDSQTTLLSMN